MEELEAMKAKLQELIEAGPDIDPEETGLPVGAFKGSVIIGKAIPINKRNWNNIEITAEDSILDCSSQIVPLIIKKPNIFPPKLPEDEDDLRYRRPKKVTDHQGDGQGDNADDGEASDGDGQGDDEEDEDGQTNHNSNNDNEDDGEQDEEENGQEGDRDINGVTDTATPNATLNSTVNSTASATPGVDSQAQPKRRGRKPKYMTEDANQTQELINTPSSSSMLTLSDYYNSAPGNLLLSIGLSRAKEWVHRDAIKQLHKAIRKQGELEEYVEDMKRQQAMYQACKAANSIFVSTEPKRCHLCDFKSDTQVGLEYHLSIPHLSPKREYKCNFCPFATRDAKAIQEHFTSLHNKPCIVETPPQLYECCICPYESSQKQKAAAHLAKCLKFFSPEKVQQLPDLESDYPAITPKPITQMDIKVYEVALERVKKAVSTPGVTVPEIPGLPRGLINQMLHITQQNYQASLAKQRQAAIAKKNQQMQQQQSSSPSMKGQAGAMSGSAMAMAKNAAPQLFHMLQKGGPGGHSVVQAIQGSPGHKASAAAAQQSSLLNRQAMKHRQMAGSQMSGTMKNPAYGTQATGANKVDAGRGGTFVICEICDGYIKDLDQLRTHMQWIHKVKIQPKMLASRPPLNCQKCQWRFFTDQGLERHLLGAHGLVTTNMQDMVNQNSDGGRCTVCGRVFSNKLVSHMNQVHKITLKPAHLSYKCTVCSATFNLYRLFESHVYKVHSGPTRKSSNTGSNDGSRKNADNNDSSSDHPQEPAAKKPKVHSSHEYNANQNGSVSW